MGSSGTGMARVQDISELVRLAGEFASERRRSPGRVWGLPTGFANWDRLTGGLHPGEVTVVAARTSVGKTTLAMQVALQVAGYLQASQDPRRVLVVSPEMSGRELALRLISCHSRVPSDLVKEGQLSNGELERWAKSAAAVGALKDRLLVWAGGSLTLGDLVVGVEEVHTERSLALLVVDYLQLIKGIGSSRYEEVSETSRQVRGLATGLNIAVLANCQLNRPEGRGEEKPPSMFELRDSGNIEQDADNVVLLWRQPVQDRLGFQDRSSLTNVHLAKQRSGRPGSFQLVFLGETHRFEEREG